MISVRIFLGITACALPLLVAITATGSVPDPTCDVTTGMDGDPGIPQYLIVGTSVLVTKDDLTPEEFAEHEAREYGEHGLWFGLPEDGVLRAGDIKITPEGLIEWRKFGFYRDDIARGYIEMTGSRRDDPSATFKPHLPDGYGTYGFQVGGGWFSEGGCWDFIVTSGAATMAFTIWVQSGSVPIATPSAVFPVSTPVASMADCSPTTNLDGEPGTPQYEIPFIVNTETDGTPISTELYGDDTWFYGQEGIWIGLPEEGVLGPPWNGSVNRDGSVDWGKIWMYRDDEARGQVEITAILRGVVAAYLVPHIPSGYGTYGFQVASLTFSDVGCWDVTVTSGTATMHFSLWVQYEPAPDATPVASPAA